MVRRLQTSGLGNAIASSLGKVLSGLAAVPSRVSPSRRVQQPRPYPCENIYAPTAARWEAIYERAMGVPLPPPQPSRCPGKFWPQFGIMAAEQWIPQLEQALRDPLLGLHPSVYDVTMQRCPDYARYLADRLSVCRKAVWCARNGMSYDDGRGYQLVCLPECIRAYDHRQRVLEAGRRARAVASQRVRRAMRRW
jgi:hypothetical protein